MFLVETGQVITMGHQREKISAEGGAADRPGGVLVGQVGTPLGNSLLRSVPGAQSACMRPRPPNPRLYPAPGRNVPVISRRFRTAC
jgi:hypothetical protein